MHVQDEHQEFKEQGGHDACRKGMRLLLLQAGNFSRAYSPLFVPILRSFSHGWHESTTMVHGALMD
jgi:hypothetical protein